MLKEDRSGDGNLKLRGVLGLSLQTDGFGGGVIMLDSLGLQIKTAWVGNHDISLRRGENPQAIYLGPN